LKIADDKKGDIYSALILEIYKLGKSISCIINGKLLIPKVENHNKSIFYTPENNLLPLNNSPPARVRTKGLDLLSTLARPLYRLNY
jgi:hypothetical protein